MSKVWLFSKPLDLIVLFTPVWLCWGISFLLPDTILDQDIPLWFWVIFILGIDVTHVWSTIFRTYTDPEAFKTHKKLLIRTPFIAFLVLLLLSLYSSSLFWSTMAYVALFHFMKQQYGFLAIYKAKSKDFQKKPLLSDARVLYFAMGYPIVYWHLNAAIQFNWFAENDFWALHQLVDLQNYFTLFNSIYWIVLAYWLFQEVRSSITTKTNIRYPKILWILTTAVNWYLGIVYFNSDIVFSLTNVVAHGVPYIALTFYYVTQKNKLTETSATNFPVLIFKMSSVILILALVEEYLWDLFVNHEKAAFFESLLPYPFIDSEFGALEAVMIALLSVPQVTHYIIDGYIWKSNAKNPLIKSIFLNN